MTTALTMRSMRLFDEAERSILLTVLAATMLNMMARAFIVSAGVYDVDTGDAVANERAEECERQVGNDDGFAVADDCADVNVSREWLVVACVVVCGSLM